MSDDDVPMGGLAAQDGYDPFAAEQFANHLAVAGVMRDAFAPARAGQFAGAVQYCEPAGEYHAGRHR